MSRKPKILILGHGRHGKDTLAEVFDVHSNLSFTSSSRAASEIFLYEQMKDEFGYSSIDECFEDRHNHREYWRQAIADYNTPDKARLCREILSKNDIYVGMRCDLEYDATNHLFDMIIYVDASPRVSYIDPTMKVTPKGNHRLVFNHMGLDFLTYQAMEILNELKFKGFEVEIR